MLVCLVDSSGVCSLGEEYMCGCICVVGVRRGGLEGYVFCCDKNKNKNNPLFQFYFLFFIIN